MQHDFILLDRSGSMGSRWIEALSSINAYVKKLAEDKVDTGVTLAAFDFNIGKLDYTVLRDRIIPSTWHIVTNKDAEPRGGTPLNDAIIKMVAAAEAGNYDKVALIIMTDGHENASEQKDHRVVKSLLDRCREKGWQVIFLGADYDNAAQATSYGAMAAQHVSSTTRNLGATMDSLADKRVAYGLTGQVMAYSADEKAAAKK